MEVGGEFDIGKSEHRAGNRIFFSPILCAKSGTVGNHLDQLSFYYPFLIGLQPLTQSVRPSNTLHVLHNNTQTLLMMYELRDAVQDTHCTCPKSRGILLRVYIYVCVCYYAYV